LERNLKYFDAQSQILWNTKVTRLKNLLTLQYKGVHGTVWFSFEVKSHPNCEIKKHVV